MIGDMYGIGKETEDEYVIKLDNSTCCSWLEVLQNNQQMEWGMSKEIRESKRWERGRSIEMSLYWITAFNDFLFLMNVIQLNFDWMIDSLEGE